MKRRADPLVPGTRVMLVGVSSTGAESTSGVYEILVRGNLGDAVVGGLGARSFAPRRGKTLVVVDVIDQAHLHGILESLRDQGIEIERVNPV